MNGRANPGHETESGPNRALWVFRLLILVIAATLAPDLLRAARELVEISRAHPIVMGLVAIALLASIALSHRKVRIPDHPAIREQRPLTAEEMESGEAERFLRDFKQANKFSWRRNMAPYLLPLAVIGVAKLLGAI